MNEITELSTYNNQISFVQQKANELTISNEEDMAKASDMLSELKLVETALNETKVSITRPIMDSLASVRDLFKPLEKNFTSAKTTIKAKMLDYSVAEEKRITEEQARVEKRLEKGTLRTDTAIRKMEEIGEVKKSFAGSAGKTSIRTVTKMRIADESLIPREYLTPDLKKITDAVLREKLSIPGVETYDEKSVVARKN